ncbi:hypothetical protein E2562_017741 [Oryza meyeriana var. granulata]|uniref:Uncharacterized protein n=1 Tax=Oryza meyeriana var. granulata TaxID=110450 RepID=A0A6G1BXB7_9ORYZ|nr:hypothetical protein E2562_017741 [Oryza meyeriana var. granulata]
MAAIVETSGDSGFYSFARDHGKSGYGSAQHGTGFRSFPSYHSNSDDGSAGDDTDLGAFACDHDDSDEVSVENNTGLDSFGNHRYNLGHNFGLPDSNRGFLT